MRPTAFTRLSMLLLAATLANCAQNPVTGNPNLVLMSESQEIAIGKREDSRSTRAACLFHGKDAFLVAGQARTAEGFKQYEGDIQATILSFREMTDEERALARPLRLRVVTAQPGLTYAALAREAPLGRFAAGHLRVINGQYPTGEPMAGQPLKIIE